MNIIEQMGEKFADIVCDTLAIQQDGDFHEVMEIVFYCLLAVVAYAVCFILPVKIMMWILL